MKKFYEELIEEMSAVLGECVPGVALGFTQPIEMRVDELVARVKADVAVMYGNKSVAEQNSVEVAWTLLMEDDFADLRRAIYATEEEFLQFRQLIAQGRCLLEF